VPKRYSRNDYDRCEAVANQMNPGLQREFNAVGLSCQYFAFSSFIGEIGGYVYQPDCESPRLVGAAHFGAGKVCLKPSEPSLQ